MKIRVYGNDILWAELTRAGEAIEWTRAVSPQDLFTTDAEAYFNLSAERIPASKIDKPYFINSVADTLKELNAGKNTIRINGWSGFLAKETWEVSGNITNTAKDVLFALGKKIIEVADEPGFISARVIAMVINEAFYALEEGVSMPNEINIAMKLGTNYPFGPFEWAEKIGLENIFALLKKLAQKDEIYQPASSLLKKTNR